MTRAAIYTRRSTDEHQFDSLDVQRTEARRYIESKGWLLSPEHEFADDAVSRAEFKKRPALLALLNGAQRGEFDVVVVRDESRLGGDMHRTGLIIQDLLDAGVRLFYYYSEEEITLDSAVDKFLVAARSFAAELEREKTAQRTREHLKVKAERALNVGGRVYGYDNVEIKEGGRRTHVEYKINEEQAKIINWIFSRYADGFGLRAIAKELNERGVASPRVGKRGTGSWSPSCIRAMLRRERYRGVVTWGKEGKAYKGGTRVRVQRPECERVTMEVPEHRIVPESLWQAVQKRMEKNRKFSGKSGRKGPPAKHLFSGLARCGECGGPMQAVNGKVGQQVVKVYACAWHRSRGETVCSNKTRRPVESVNETVISWIRSHVLTEEVIAETVKEVRKRLAARAETPNVEVAALEKELGKLRREIDRLTEALASSEDPPAAVMKAITERDKRARSIEAQLEAHKKAPELAARGLETMEAEARRRLENLQGLLERNQQDAHRAMKALLEDRLTFTPITDAEGRKRIRVEGTASVGALFAEEGKPATQPGHEARARFTREGDPNGI